MIFRNLPNLKSIAGAVILLSILSVGLLSLTIMNHDGISAHHGCLGLSVGASPCEALTSLVSCLRVHLGVLQVTSQAVSTFIIPLLIASIITALWLVVKKKGGDPEALSRLRLQWSDLDFGHNILLKKLGRWLRLLEKRDPAQSILMVLGVLLMRAR